MCQMQVRMLEQQFAHADRGQVDMSTFSCFRDVNHVLIFGPFPVNSVLKRQQTQAASTTRADQGQDVPRCCQACARKEAPFTGKSSLILRPFHCTSVESGNLGRRCSVEVSSLVQTGMRIWRSRYVLWRSL